MAAIDFNKALDVKASEVAPVPVPPTGHYVFRVTKVPEINDGDEWWSINFQAQGVKVFEDADDVDADLLKEYGKPTSIQNRVSFMINKKEGTDADMINLQNRIKRFCVDHLQIDGGEDMTLRQLLNASVNKTFVGQITHRADKQDPEIIRANIGRTAPVTD